MQKLTDEEIRIRTGWQITKKSLSIIPLLAVLLVILIPLLNATCWYVKPKQTSDMYWDVSTQEWIGGALYAEVNGVFQLVCEDE